MDALIIILAIILFAAGIFASYLIVRKAVEDAIERTGLGAAARKYAQISKENLRLERELHKMGAPSSLEHK